MEGLIQARRWRNWSGTVECTPAVTARPRSAEEIAQAVKHAAVNGLTVRPRGAGHSGTPLAATGSMVIDLTEWTGIEAADPGTGLVTVRSGTSIHRLNAELDLLGLALPNLGDIDTQTIGGAMATGTHGTGLRIGGMATQIVAMDMVMADGRAQTCSVEQWPELFTAAKIGLGALGVVTTLTLQCEPAFALVAEEYPEPVDAVLAQFTEYAASNDHFEFYWFPHGRNALVKRNNRLAAGAEPEPMGSVRRWFEYDLMENTALGLVCRAARAAPRMAGSLNRMCSALVSKRSYSDRSHRVLTTSRRVRFVECEYALPYEMLPAVFSELRAGVRKLDVPLIFPAEVRVARADDIWLSSAYGRDTAYISVQQFDGMPYREYFQLFESIVAEVGGRPHWGKVHTLDVHALRKRVPRLDEFRDLRYKVDPEGRFGNAHLDHVLGPIGG